MKTPKRNKTQIECRTIVLNRRFSLKTKNKHKTERTHRGNAPGEHTYQGYV